MEREYLTIQFEGESFIDFGTFIKQVGNLKESFTTLSKSILGNTKNVKIKVAPFQPGSFVFNFLIEYTNQISLFAPLMIGIGNAYVSMLNLKKHLNGSDPLSIKPSSDLKTYTVESIDGTLATFDKEVIESFAKKEVEESFTSTFKTLEKNLKNRAGVNAYVRTDSGRNNQSAQLEKKDIPILAKKVDISKHISISLDTQYSTQWLTVGDVDFLGKTKQVFLNNDKNKIIAEIEDKEFIDRKVQGLIVFKAGMNVLVNMRTEQIYVPLKDQIEYSFYIQKVIDIKYNEVYGRTSLDI